MTGAGVPAQWGSHKGGQRTHQLCPGGKTPGGSQFRGQRQISFPRPGKSLVPGQEPSWAPLAEEEQQGQGEGAAQGKAAVQGEKDTAGGKRSHLCNPELKTL